MPRRLSYHQELVRLVNLHARPEIGAAMLRNAVTTADLELAMRAAPPAAWTSGKTGEELIALARRHAFPRKR